MALRPPASRTAAISAYLDSITRALPAQPIPLADLYERASEGVYLILSVNDYGEVAQGTGFLINANGLLVTNYHVVEDMVEGAVVYEPGKFVMIDRVIRQDTVRDWAVNGAASRHIPDETKRRANMRSPTDDVALAQALRDLSSLPPLVTSWEIETLKTQLGEAARVEVL